MKTPTISDIHQATKEKSPYFFDRKTMQCWGQTKSMFKVWKGKSGAFYIAAPAFSRTREGQKERLYNTVTFNRFTGDDLVIVPDSFAFRSMDDAKEWVKTKG